MTNVSAIDNCATPMVDPERVAGAQAQLLPGDEAQKIAELFRLLGDPTRIRIVHALVSAGELCVCDLAATVELGENTVSQALRLLRTAGVVSSRRSGRRVFYSAADHHVRLVLDLAIEHIGHDVT